MGGVATFAGTTYQARVIAYVEAHVLAQMRLGWVPPEEDTPFAVSAETGGAGDDARVEFGERTLPIEIQAKHGLVGRAKVAAELNAVRSRAKDETTRVIFAVDRSSSRWLVQNVAQDLDRIRSGRSDALKTETAQLIEDVAGDTELLQRIYFVQLDLDNTHDADAKFARTVLASVLEDPLNAEKAWAVIVADAGDVAAQRLNRTRKQLVDLLEGAGIKVRAPAADDRWHRQLDFTRRLLERHHARAALSLLSQIEGDLGGQRAEPHVRYRLFQQKASALLQLDQYTAALNYARLALDIDADGSHALVSAALASLLGGDVTAAGAFARRAIEKHPNDPASWGAHAHVKAATGEDAPQVPISVLESAHYRGVLVQIANNKGDWEGVLALTSAAFASGARSEDILFFRANALLSSVASGAEIRRERVEEAERLATELVGILSDESHPLAPKAYVIRAVARRELGNHGGADADLTQARAAAGDDPDALGHAAEAKIAAGDEATALAILAHPVVDETPSLRALRARLLANSGDVARARVDVDSTLGHLADAPDPDGVRFVLADVASDLGELDLAEEILAQVSLTGARDFRYLVLAGRIAFVRDAPTVGLAKFREAATAATPANRPTLLAEAAAKLLKAERAQESIAVFEEVGIDAIPAGALRFYAHALFKANELLRAQGVIDHLAESGPLPDWALAVAADLAILQEDVEKAIAHLSQLVLRTDARPSDRIELARLLVERDRPKDAVPHLNILLESEGLTPRQRMQIAQLLRLVGREEEALPLAFRAYRDAPHDPDMNRAFVTLTLTAKVKPRVVREVAADTHVVLVESDGTRREHTIYNDGPIDRLRGELSVADAEASGIMGRRLGDEVVRNAGTWQEKRWKVAEVLPAIVFAVRDAMAHFEERFPGEPFFIMGFKIGEPMSLKAFAPMIASLEERKSHVEELFAAYHAQTLPLGFVAKMSGVSVADAMQAIAVDRDRLGKLEVEWTNAEGQAESRSAAREAKVVVLCRSALETAHRLGLLDHIGTAYRLVAPISLREQLRDEERSAENLVREGQKMLLGGAPGMHFHERPPGDPQLVNERDKVRALIAWVEKHVTLEPRPLETVPVRGSVEEQGRDSIGHESYDAMALARHLGETLYADDLGLRRFFPPGSRGRSFSTVGLLPALADRGVISAEARDKHLIELVSRGYGTVPPSREIILHAIRNSAMLAQATLADLFGLLVGPEVTIEESGRIVAQVLRDQALASVQTMSIEEITLSSLRALSRRWTAQVCGLVVVRAANTELKLLPKQLNAVREVCQRFVKASESTD